MTFHMLWVIALGLSMDAFAVSISEVWQCVLFDGNKRLPLHAVLAISRHYAGNRLCCGTTI